MTTRGILSIRLDPETRAQLDQLAETLKVGPSTLAADLVTRAVRELTRASEEVREAYETVTRYKGRQ